MVSTLCRDAGRSDEIRVRSVWRKLDLQVGATLFAQEDQQVLLVRLRPVAGGEVAAAVPAAQSLVARAVEKAPDGFVVTDPDGRVLLANPAFIELVQLGREEQLRGQSLERWMGRPGVDLSVMLATLRQQGAVRLFATSMRGELGAQAEVEISAVAVPRSLRAKGTGS